MVNALPDIQQPKSDLRNSTARKITGIARCKLLKGSDRVHMVVELRVQNFKGFI